MSHRKVMIDKLDRVLIALENSILSISNKELLLAENNRAPSVAEVRALVDHQLRIRNISSIRPIAHSKKSASRQTRNVPTVPRDLIARVALLRTLLAAQPELSPRMRSVFGGRKKPSDREVDELTKEFVRLGVLKDNDD